MNNQSAEVSKFSKFSVKLHSFKAKGSDNKSNSECCDNNTDDLGYLTTRREWFQRHPSDLQLLNHEDNCPPELEPVSARRLRRSMTAVPNALKWLYGKLLIFEADCQDEIPLYKGFSNQKLLLHRILAEWFTESLKYNRYFVTTEKTLWIKARNHDSTSCIFYWLSNRNTRRIKIVIKILLYNSVA